MNKYKFINKEKSKFLIITGEGEILRSWIELIHDALSVISFRILKNFIIIKKYEKWRIFLIL